MIIVLTEYKTGNKFTIESGLILCSRIIEKKPALRGGEAEIATHVISGIQVQGQLQAFEVSESPIEIGRILNAAMQCPIDPLLLGFPLPPPAN